MRNLEVKSNTLAFYTLFCHKNASTRTAFFPVGSGRPGKGGVLMRRLWHVLEVVAIYALKRLIDWFFTTRN